MTMRIASLLCAFSGFALAGTWNGVLVDAGCFASEEQNVTKDDGLAERDMRLSLDACAPNARTGSFAIVLSDGSALRLDPRGNSKAAELVKDGRDKSHYMGVAVDGDADKGTIRVNSIANGPSFHS